MGGMWAIENFCFSGGNNVGDTHVVFVDPVLFAFTNGDGGEKVYKSVVKGLAGVEHRALAWPA